MNCSASNRRDNSINRIISEILKKINIPEDLPKKEGIVTIYIARKENDPIPMLASSLDRTGFAIVSAPNYQELDILMKDIDTVSLETRDA
ncbi:hypothetical protein [Photobacterium galatheae]|uniref:Uncharacterized protein n=1 Tax=Photobacterium galatheae TaxID=1654360 RepID=A0A066RVB3_9GAMM|nr:hypothetical protein [Photobacterium galatheae]KDM91627.1 hypothetical protein EA58_11440 [Photobacterium galatheae]MCM0149701.1 hypothetical protein [Photobacterium galatheae]